jgi:hypothetical protein
MVKATCVAKAFPDMRFSLYVHGVWFYQIGYVNGYSLCHE